MMNSPSKEEMVAMMKALNSLAGKSSTADDGGREPGPLRGDDVLRESIEGLRRQLERKLEELRVRQEWFDAISRARDENESGDAAAGDAAGEHGRRLEDLADPRFRSSRLRAEASLAQLELNTVRNQVDHLTELMEHEERRMRAGNVAAVLQGGYQPARS